MPQYSVLEAIIVENPDFNDLDQLSNKIHDNLIHVTDEIIGLLKTNTPFSS